MKGGWLSRQRFGSVRDSSAKMAFESADHSLPSGSVMLRKPSGDAARHASFREEKFAAVTWSSGEYFVFAKSPP